MTDSATVEPPKPRRQRKSRKINPEKVIELAETGLTPSDIARHQAVSPSTITRFLEHFHLDSDALEQYTKHRADALSWMQGKNLEIQRKLIERLDGLVDTLKVPQISGLMFALNTQHGTLFDKERLERGQSTANISMISRMVDGQVSTLYKRSVTQPVVVEPEHNESENTGD